MEIPFDLITLENMATPNSFARGEDYYHSDAVRQLTYNGHAFIARVLGSYAYQVEISGTKNSPNFQCTCPYDYDGICKHIVAVGLAILDENFETVTAEDAIVVEETGMPLAQFKEIFKNTADDIKINFLRQILTQDAKLKMQFIKYLDAQDPGTDQVHDTSSTEVIEKIKEEITHHLESLTFNEYDLFEPGYYKAGGYYEEWDDAYEEAKRIIREVFERYEKQAKYHFHHGELVKGMQVILGMYEGKFSITEPAEDPLMVVEEQYPETIDKVLREIFDELFSSIDSVVKSPTEIKASIDLLFSRYQQYERRLHEVSEDIDDEEDVYAVYYLKDFEAYFFSSITDQGTAHFLLNRLQEKNLADIDTAFVILRLAEQLDDEQLWLKTANEFALYEVAIAKLLLNKYQSQGQTGEFIHIAKQAFQQFPDQMDEYLAVHMPADGCIDFYKKVHLHLIKRTHRIEYYYAIRTYLSEQEKEDLICIIGASFDHLFYVRLLALEERFHDILQRAHDPDIADYQFDKLIEPVIHVYPEACFNMLHQKCLNAIGQRGRQVYRMIVRWLQLMQQIEGFSEETNALIQQLYNHKPHLPALKDEMSNGRLI